MFRKAPLKTYQRKKAGGASTTINPSTIIREDISDNKDLQPKEFLAFKDTDKSLEYDPFDTTFDRIARDVKMPPPIQHNQDEDSYSSSSNDANNSSLDASELEPLPDPLPIINPKPILLRRNFKKLKVDKDVSTVKIVLKNKARRGKFRNDKSIDENTEPNLGQKSEKRKKNIIDSNEQKNVAPKKKRRVVIKPVVSSYRGRRNKKLDRSKGFMHCSVNLTRLDDPLTKSTADTNSTNNISNGEKMGSSYSNEEEILREAKNTSILKNPTPKKLVEDHKMSQREEENSSTFRNPTVSLTRLNVPPTRFSVANKYWFNSTPMTTKTRPTTSLHFSPITTDKSMETTDRNENDSYESQNLKPAAPKVQLKNFTPKKSRASRFSNRRKRIGKNSSKSKPLLSDSPDPEPSGLMFDDTEIMAPSVDSYPKLEERGNKNAAEDSTMSPFKGFSRGPPNLFVADSQSTSRTVLATIENYNTMEVSSIGPFKGFTKASINSELPHFTSYESDKIETSSKDLLHSLEETHPDTSAPLAPTEDQVSKIEEATDPVTFRRSENVQQKSSKESPKGQVSRLEKSAPEQQNYSEDNLEVTQNTSGETEILQDSSDKSTEILHESSDRSTEVLQESSDENIKEQFDSLNESETNQQDSLNESAQDSSIEGIEDAQMRSKVSLKNRQGRSRGITETWHDSLQDDSIDLRTRLKKHVRSRQRSSENRQTSVHENQKSRQSILDLSAYDTKNISKEIAEDWESSLGASSQAASEQKSSDSSWETTTEVSKGDLSSSKSSENATPQRENKESIVQVSSDEGNTSYENSVAFVDASENFSQTEYDSHQEESSSFEVDESSKVKTVSKSKAKADQSSVVEHSWHQDATASFDDQMLLKYMPRNSLQPVVLVSRCDLPIEELKRTSHYKNTRLTKPNVSIESIKEFSSDKEDSDVEKSINQSLASESIEWNNLNEGSVESQESQDDETSLRVDELSGDGEEIEEPTITKLSDRDSSNGSLGWSFEKVENPRRSSLKKIKIDKRNREESFKVPGVKTRKSQVRETLNMSHENTQRESGTSIQPVVLLNRLNDSVRVADRRKKYRNWGLSAISEDLPGKNATTIDEEPEDFQNTDTEMDKTNTQKIYNEPKIKLSDNRKTNISQTTTVSCDASQMSNQSNGSIYEDKVVFLKPGKSWSRSLSLFRQVHSQEDVESLAIGKGKKWRQSVQSVLDMQQQGVIQSCVKKNADDKESRSCYGVRNSAAAWIPGSSQPNTSGVFSQTSVGSPGRFIRRISIRVVPDRKNSELYEDSPFLEAYGITSSENRKTIGKRSTLIAPRKTLVYNVKCADVSFENIPKCLSVTSREVVLAQCGQDTSVPFQEFYPDSFLRYCRKIGEGVFGEVFLYEKGAEKNVIKIIPIEGELKVNGERQKKFDEILSEIVIAKELNNLRFAETSKTSSFVEVKNIRCVVGHYPPMLIDLWNTFDNEKNSENDCPDMFDKDQLYIVLELGHGGQDLEAFVFQNSSEAHALFIQTALALAVAEESLEFEHRDLHWGNILISRTEDSQINYKLRNKDIKVASKGVKVSVIDFTLSRMSYQGCSIFNDLSLDDDLFAAQGEYQFEIYRLMRQKVENNWQTFEPFTNILWLHYTLDKMITAVRYRRTASKIHKSGIDKLKVLKNEILGYKSAFDFVTNCDNVTRLQESRSNVSSTVASTD